MMTLATLFTFVGLLILALSIPLMRRKVPMNAFYGVRIPGSFDSEERWYDINEYGGRQLARWSLFVVAFGIVGFFLPASALSVYPWVVLPLVLASVLVPVIRVVVWARRYR